ncbi:MAG: serpin family protein [Bacteroidales bacterium]|nr:serpin family protein [Bacteroidales bacterium]
MKKIIFILCAAAVLSCSCCASRKAAKKTAPPTPSSDYVFGLFDRVSGRDNTFFSPLSLSLALSMTATGAEGETYDQMVETLGLGKPTREELYAQFEALSKALAGADTSVVMEIANSIWVDDGFPVRPAFEKGARKHYGAEIGSVDFDSPSAASRINSWCSDKTHGKIPQVVGETPGWKMALVNAVYFKAAWEQAFERTVEGTFKGVDQPSKATFLLRKGFMSYAEDDDYQMVELQYGERGRFVLDVVLPKAGFDAAPRLTQARFDTLAAALGQARVNFKMPEFKIESTLNLADILSAMGMSRAFTGAAQFGLISELPLMIDNVLQKTYIDLDKNGTEAAAVTVVSMRLTSIGPGHEPAYIDFIADRPFQFVIREKESGTIMFVGQKVK